MPARPIEKSSPIFDRDIEGTRLRLRMNGNYARLEQRDVDALLAYLG